MALAGFLTTAQTITGTHTDFPALLVAANFTNADATALDGTTFSNGGGNVIVYTDQTKTTRVPIEVVEFVTGGTPSVQIWAKHPSMQTGATFWVEADSVQVSQPAVTDTFGRNAVWSAYEAVLHCMDTSWTDSTGNGDLSPAGATPPTVVTSNGQTAYRFIDSDSTFLTRSVSIAGGSRPLTIQIRAVSTVISGGAIFGASLSDSSGGSDYSAGFAATGFSRRLSVVTPVNVINESSSLTPGNITGEDIYSNCLWDTDDSLNYRGYISGNFLSGSSSSSYSATGFTLLGLGGRIDGSPNYYTMDIVEARFSQTAISTSQIDVEYLNQSATSTFWTSSDWTAGGGGITVSAETQDYNINFFDASIDLTGEILVNAGSQGFNLTFYDAAVDLTGEVLVNAEPQSYSITFYDAQVSLVSGIEVQAQTQDYNVTFYDAQVSLFGQIDVTAEAQQFNVKFFDAFVDISELWKDKAPAATTWTDATKASTIWTDK